jgi:NADPH-dependent curcumin reductase CurA
MISAYNQDDAFTSRAHGQHCDPAGAHAGVRLPRPPRVRPQAYRDLIRWHLEGKIKYRVDVVEGLKTPLGSKKLFTFQPGQTLS